VSEYTGVIPQIPADITIEGFSDTSRTVIKLTEGSSFVNSCALNGVTLKDLEITGGKNAIRSGYLSEGATFTLENCKIDGIGTYCIHFDGDGEGNVIVRNCELESWISVAAALKSITFENCTIDNGKIYSVIRPYTPCTFTKCKFTEAFITDTDEKYGSRIHATENENVVITLNGCSVVDKDGNVSSSHTIFEAVARIGNSAAALFDCTLGEDKKVTNGTVIANADSLSKYISADTLFLKGHVQAVRYYAGNNTFTAAAVDFKNGSGNWVKNEITGTIEVPQGVDFRIDTGVTFAEGAKICVPYD